MLRTIDSIDELTSVQLNEIVKTGFCYVKLPDAERTQADLSILRSRALDFFRQSKSDKLLLAVNDAFEGYADRQDGKVPQSAQQFFFRPDKPVGPFVNDKSLISSVTGVFQNQIGLPLIRRVFELAGQPAKFPGLTEKPFSSFSFVYYPEIPEKKCDRGITAHKDFDFITVLQVNKKGLQVWIDGLWVDVEPRNGYVVVNFANALELMLGGACTSALHRVLLPKEERISIGLFIGPDMGPKLDKPMMNLITNEVLFDSYAQYLDQQFKQQYEEPVIDLDQPSTIEKLRHTGSPLFQHNVETSNVHDVHSSLSWRCAEINPDHLTISCHVTRIK